MESVLKARERLAKYPVVFAKCSKEASHYGRCVCLNIDDLKKDQCSKEYQQLLQCFKTVAKDMKTKL